MCGTLVVVLKLVFGWQDIERNLGCATPGLRSQLLVHNGNKAGASSTTNLELARAKLRPSHGTGQKPLMVLGEGLVISQSESLKVPQLKS